MPFKNISHYLSKVGILTSISGQKFYSYKNYFKLSDAKISCLIIIYYRNFSNYNLLFSKSFVEFKGKIDFEGNSGKFVNNIFNCK